MVKSRRSIGKIVSYTYAPAVVMFILLFVYFIKDIAPFGANTIDFWDMGQMNVPMYYHVYDFLHGTKSLLFDWYTGLGTNMTEVVSICSLLSPFNLFFYFVPREHILESLSIFNMLKMMGMAASLYALLQHKFCVNTFWKVLFSVSYAFSGFVLQYYTNNQWLDIAAMFPLLLLALDILFQSKRLVPYITMLTLCLVTNFYLSSMILLFLFFIGGLYLLLLSPKEKRKQQIWSLGIGTFTALGLSACMVLPTMIQISQSQRANTTGQGFDRIVAILNSVDATDLQKWWMLFGTALVLVIIIKGIFATKTDKRTTLFVVSSILMLTLQIGFENINLIWHFGSYVWYPMRFGFITSLVFLMAGCYYVGKLPYLNEFGNDIPTISSKFDKIYPFIMGACIVGILVPTAIYCHNRFIVNNYKATLFYAYYFIFIALLLIYTFLLRKNNRALNYRIIGSFVLAELVVGAYVFICPPAAVQNACIEQNSEFVYTTNTLKKDMGISPSDLERIKNIGGTLNANYPLILQRAALSNWTHSVTKTIQTSMWHWGYTKHYTRLIDSGGTVFSDALLNIKQTLSPYALDTSLYSLVSEQDEYYLYDNTYTLPFGITVSSDIASIDETTYSHFDLQNAVFNQLSGQHELIHVIQSGSKKDSNIVTSTVRTTENSKQVITYKMTIQGNQALYFYGVSTSKNIQLYVDGKIIPIPSIKKEESTAYPDGFNSNMISMGAFHDRIIEVKVVCPTAVLESQVAFGLLDMDKLATFTQSYAGYTANETTTKQGMSLTVNGTAEKNMLFLPVVYDKGWTCTVNGKTTEIVPITGAFTGIPLEEGVNTVKLTFLPSGMKTGILISLTTLLLLIAGILIQKKFRLEMHDAVLFFIEITFFLVWFIAVVCVYVVPILYTLIHSILTSV